jgi:UDP-N-acetylglucosamine diphosphorylase / glucose-1-phosphate thymidylyltransferase / UDP-N-acetylgalactosamine diphosphorylase / glucosamine-1-phosphate N-acetyltransferase / galactosamine-1-phosphate N-acetyltransferase
MTARSPALYLYDDARARAFAPFALTRPAGELRAGAELVRRRWELALGTSAEGHLTAPHLADFEELDAPPAAAEPLPAGSIVANSRCVVALDPLADGASSAARVWTCCGRVAAVRLGRELDAAALDDGNRPLETVDAGTSPVAEVDGRWTDEIWDYVRDLGAQLGEDIARLGPRLASAGLSAGGAVVVGEHPVYVEPRATVEPYVVFDTSAGPILVREGASVQAFTRVIGPCFIGEGATVAVDRIGGSSIGERSRIHGEMSATIVLGHSNKAHDGFVGHSYLGRWVNLGAGTITSNLKNTYGTVALWTPGGTRDTGLQFLGSLVGDHAKTGIGTRLTTGTVLGAGANVYGSSMPSKAVPPFAWGEGAPYASYRLDKFLQVVERAMARRQVTLGARGRRQLAAAYAAAQATSGPSE